MTRQLKKATLATSLALAFGLPFAANAAQGVAFDPDGVGGVGPYVVKAFDWGAGHVLYKDCFGEGAIGQICTIYAQGSISALVAPNNSLQAIPGNVTYTFTLVTKARMTLPKKSLYDGSFDSGTALNFVDVADATSLFTIYADKTPISAADPLAGTGYMDDVAILTGRVSIDTFGLVNTGAATQLLDQNGADNWGGLRTYATSGSPTFTIDVLSIDSTYFLDPIGNFSMVIDANQADNSTSPFKQTDPSKIVAGQSFANGDVGPDTVNDIYCLADGETPGGERCSAQFQGDAITTFVTQTTLPEPSILGLLGIGLAGLGGLVRRRKASA